MERVLMQPLIAMLISFLIAIRAYKKKSLNFSGALSGFLVMSIHLAANISSSKLTKIGAEKKRKSDVEYKDGGQRNWLQVLCNSVVAAVLVATIWKLVRWDDKCLDSRESSLITALIGGIIGHYCCCNGDTWSSEIGVLSEAQPRLITTFKPVRKGTNGGVTRTGLLAAAAGGGVIGLTFVVLGFVTAKCSADIALKQLLVIPLSALSGLGGSVIDSLLGATLQFSGFCSVRNKFFIMPDSTESTVTVIDVTDPLYCHPNDVGSSLKITPILTGVENYIPWKRGMELALSAKRKVGFITGAVEKPKRDNVRIEAWISANSLVISWILQNVSESIKMAILYTQSAKEIWKLLRERYLVSNGARKYKLNKDTYECKQKGKPVTDYYIQLRSVWDELENLNDYPVITVITEEISAFLDVMQRQKEEARLFQFLNGLDSEFNTQRSAILLMSPLPTVDTAMSIMVQEEAQQQNIQPNVRYEPEVSALMVKGEQSESACKHCGFNNHTTERCWYAPGNQRARRGGFTSGRSQGSFRGNRGAYRGRGRNTYTTGYGGSYNSTSGGSQNHNSYIGGSQNSGYTGGFNKRVANNVQSEPSNAELAAALAATNQQLENLMKYVPGPKSGVKYGNDTDEEIDCNYAGTLSCHNVKMSKKVWILDSGASDHMITDLSKLSNIKAKNLKINLPNGGTSCVTHIGDMKLESGMKLANAIIVSPIMSKKEGEQLMDYTT
ncbi:hypothetical protein KSS87_016289 [Heliosperma pusillum]|nr:hypothetical protein KSS87_016289 [Heliosperma pusillum]